MIRAGFETAKMMTVPKFSPFFKSVDLDLFWHGLFNFTLFVVDLVL